KVEPLKIDLTNMDDRLVRLTIHSSDLAGAVLTPDGEKLFYLARFEKGYDLWQTETRTKETKIAAKIGADGASQPRIDKDGKNIYFATNTGMQRYDIEKG